MKRKLMALVLVLACATSMALAGCGNSSGSVKTSTQGLETKETKTKEDTKTTGGNVKLTFSIWDTYQQPAMQDIADGFNKENPNISVSVEVTPWDEYWTKLEAATTGGQMPDISWMHTNEFTKYAANDMLLEVTDLYEGEEKDGFQKFPEGLVTLYTYDGKIYGVPKDYDTIGLAYNKEIFDNAGISYPDETWDWAKTVEVAQQLTDATKGIYGFAAPYSDQEGFHDTVYQNGGFIVADGKCGYASDATKEGLQYYIDFQKKFKVSPTMDQFADVNATDMFQSGQIAMMFLGTWNAPTFSANEDIAGKYDIAVIPQGKTRATIYNGLAFAGSAKSKNIDAVKAFLKYAGSEEGNLLAAKRGTAIPAYEGAGDAWLKQNVTGVNLKAYTDMLEYGVASPSSKTRSKWKQLEKDYIMQVYNETLTLDEATTKLQEEIDKLLATE